MSAKRPPRIDLNPSSAERWTTCTASPQFIMDNHDKIPPSDTVWSQEGTTAHEVAAATLQNRAPNLSQCPTPIDADMRLHGWNYAEYVTDLAEDGHKLLFEQKLPLWYMPKRNAIVDAAVINPDSLHIVDYKYGAGVVVDTEQNLQLVIYAYNIAATLDKLPDEDFPVTLHIYQPRGRAAEDKPVHKWETTWGEIAKLGKMIAETASDIIDGNLYPEWQPRFAPSEKACQWCPAKGFCQARVNALTEGIEPLVKFEDAPVFSGGIALPSPTTIEHKQIIAVLRHGDQIKKWLEDVQDYALSYMKAGGTLPGFKLVLSRGGNRYWADPVKAAKAMLKDTLLREDEVYERKVISPPQAEKLLGKGKFPKELFNLVAKPPGQPVIAPEDDKRESCVIDAKSEFTAEYALEDF